MATWPVFASLCVFFLLCYAGFQWRHAALGEHVRVFDVRFWYTPDEARALLEMMGERGRRIYALTQITLDFIFPFVYGGLIVILLLKLNSTPRYWLPVPLLAVVADLLENITTAYLAWSYTGVASPVAWVAATFTAVKRGALALSCIIVLAALALFLWRRLRASA